MMSSFTFVAFPFRYLFDWCTILVEFSVTEPQPKREPIQGFFVTYKTACINKDRRELRLGILAIHEARATISQSTW